MSKHSNTGKMNIYGDLAESKKRPENFQYKYPFEFSWEKPIEHNLLRFTEFMIRTWKHQLQSNENFMKRGFFGRLFDNNDTARAKIKGAIMAYESVSKQILKEMEMRMENEE